MKMFAIKVGLIVAIVSFTGCVTGGVVVSNVSVFHALPDAPIEAVEYSFAESDGDRESLEHEAYKQLIRQHLANYYFVEVPNDRSSVVVDFHYRIGGPESKIGSSPVYGQTGVSSSSTYGSVSSSGSFNATTHYTPSFGVVGSSTYSYTNYTRDFFLTVSERASAEPDNWRNIYEAHVTSTGISGLLAEVLPTMIEAVFVDFPGESGTTHKVRGRLGRGG